MCTTDSVTDSVPEADTTLTCMSPPTPSDRGLRCIAVDFPCIFANQIDPAKQSGPGAWKHMLTTLQHFVTLQTLAA